MNEAQPDDDLSYGDLILGSSMTAILEATDAATPVINESRFLAQVLPLLERPFYHQSMVAYTRFVHELTNALRVVSDSDPQKVLFEVPPFIQTTGVTLPAKGAPTSDTTLGNIYREGDRGADVNRMIANFMRSVTAKPDLQKTLLDPLKAILARYGRVMDMSDEKNQIETQAAPAGANAVPGAPAAAPIPAGDSSFTGEYE